MLSEEAQEHWDAEASGDGHDEPAAPSEADGHYKPAAPSAADAARLANATAAAPPPPPLPHDSARPRKRLRRKTADANFAQSAAKNAAPLSATVDALREDATRNLTASEEQQKPDELHFFNIEAMADGPDSRSKLEAAVQSLADLLRDDPTVPADLDDPEVPCKLALLEDAAVELPQKHCAFKGCAWRGSTAEHQIGHLREVHQQHLGTVTTLMHRSHADEDKLAGAYNAAISRKVQQGAPLACYAIDRRSVRNYVANLDDSNVEALICFCCARRFSYVESIGSNQINWVTPCQDPSLFFGMSHRDSEKILGLATYLKRYGHCAGQGMPNLNLWLAEFEDFVLDVNVDGRPLRLLCCPEDLQCENVACAGAASRCRQCRVPLCTECSGPLEQKLMLPPALTNDIMLRWNSTPST